MTSATMPATVRLSIELPFPVSANRLWRQAAPVVHSRRGSFLGRTRVYLSPQYDAWLHEADGVWLAQKGKGGWRPLHDQIGHYTLELVFDATRRRRGQDGDNLCKCVHDWLQRVEIIKNDALCDGASWVWGEAPAGCLATLQGRPVMREAG